MISTLHTFPTTAEAFQAGETFLRNYPPQGYGSWYRVSELVDGTVQLICARWGSCD